MGLDNGIEIKIHDESIADRFERFKETFNDGKDVWYEACYMRKWWGVRNDLVGYLNRKYGAEHDNDGEWTLDIDDLKEFIEIYTEWDDEEKWDDEGNSIWTYEEVKEYQDFETKIEELKYLIAYKRLAPDAFDLVFYDSY